MINAWAGRQGLGVYAPKIPEVIDMLKVTCSARSQTPGPLARVHYFFRTSNKFGDLTLQS